MKVLSYHKFYYNFNEYLYSRTYQQFKNDILNSSYDVITIDDGYFSTLKACEILDRCNKQCILYIPTNLIGTDGLINLLTVIPITEIVNKGIPYIRNHFDEGKYSKCFDDFWNYFVSTWMVKYDPCNCQG